MNSLRIGQINIAKSNLCQHVIFNSLNHLNFHIICVQECWMGEIRLPISNFKDTPPTFETVSHPAWEVFHPIPIAQSLPKVCIYVRKDISRFYSFSPHYF